MDGDKTRKNRRYVALRKLIKEDNEYFSDWEMRTRDPLLYNDMIGKYLNEQGRFFWVLYNFFNGLQQDISIASFENFLYNTIKLILLKQSFF